MQEEKKKRGNTAEVVREMAEPLAEALGLRIWDVVFLKEGADWFLRIFIDSDEGISIDNCVDMTHAINPILDEKDPISQEYTLEVCSPGINRRLRSQAHFEAVVGEVIEVKLIRPLENGERILRGELLEVKESGEFEIKLDEETSVTLIPKECSSVILFEDDFSA